MTTKDEPSQLDGDLQPDPAPEPVYCTLGETLCRVCVWTEQEWTRLAHADRPPTAEYFLGLGWVGAVPDWGPR